MQDAIGTHQAAECIVRLFSLRAALFRRQLPASHFCCRTPLDEHGSLSSKKVGLGRDEHESLEMNLADERTF